MTPILFYSGAAADADKVRALNAGKQGYLVKPAENERLVAEVNRLIADAKLTHQNEIRIAIQL